MALTESLVYIGVFIALTSFIRSKFFWLSDIPGPFLASIGTCYNLLQVCKGRAAEEIEALHKKHGPFVRIGSNEVSVSHPDGARLILQAPLWKTRFYTLFAIPNSNYNNIMAMQDPNVELAKRVHVIVPFSMGNLLKLESNMDKMILLLEKRLLQATRCSSVVDFGEWIRFLVWDIVGEFTFSKRFGFLDTGSDVGNVQKNTFWLGFYVTFMGYCQWLHAILLGNPILRWLDFQPNEHTYTTCVQALSGREKIKRASMDMVDHWTKAHEKHPNQFSARDIFCAAVGNVGAGGDGPAAAVNAFFYLLMKADPSHLERLVKEIDQAQAEGRLSRVVQYNEAVQLPFLQACVKETLRCFPTVAWQLSRIVPEGGLTIGGKHFKAGTFLSVNPYVVHRDEAMFGADAHVYNPGRWLTSPDQLRRLESYMIPFGAGYNACPGQNLARLELLKITATIVRDFDISLANPDGEWKYHRTFIVPQTGWDCVIKRRHEGLLSEDADQELMHELEKQY